jgi:hypothetical protein
MLDWLLPRVLLVLGAGFFVANLRLCLQFVQFLRIRSKALLTWPSRRPPYYPLVLGLGVALGALMIVKLALLQRPPTDWFGEAMMFVYYACLQPMSLRIGRGFYEDGVWVDNGFLPYTAIGSLSWREEREITLLLVPRMKQLARKLVVPQQYYGAARRLLRDLIARHEIIFGTRTLDLGAHDERDDV